jgi:signal peptidase II
MILAVVLGVIVGSDQASKSVARDRLAGRGTLSYCRDTFRLQLAENPGAFLSLGASLPAAARVRVFTVGTAAVLLAVLGYALVDARARPAQVAALGLILSGGLGNLIDRVRFDGYVTDFLNLGVGWLRTGIFNVADMALMAGVALLLLQQRSSR